MKTLSDIRSAYLDYFKSKGHEVVPSSPLVPHNDPTLMFTNAGMVQFKDTFIGKEKRPYVRAASSQKCVRAGGKHNDLDNVGYTARHHTFFEMLGNFSFGDYFKEGAIEYAWEFVTKIEGLNKDNLYFTVYHTDDEAFNLWKKIAGVSDSRILRVPTKDNFWSMGDTGPCGPCSEIFYDHGEKIGNGKWKLDSHGHDLFGERFVEIWNLVFMQFEALPDGRQIPLPKPSIDTGAGLERHAAVMQGTHDNYETDLFKSLINNIEEVSGFRSQVSEKETRNPKPDTAPFRIIADHLRASGFLIADGVLPLNEGRGYVLRRIMRRAMRYAHQLGCKEPLMYKLVPELVTQMGDAYPELKRAQPLIVETLKHEEERFKETLEKGLKLLDEEIQKISPSLTLPRKREREQESSLPLAGGIEGGNLLPGSVAFKLYDTYGFPLDLTQDILRGREIDVDIKGFNENMEQQKARARAAWSGSGAKATEEIWFDIKEKNGATEFLGYEQEKTKGKIVAIVVNGKIVQSAKENDEVAIVTNQTPFYGESGGQMGDHGTLLTDAVKINITDTKKYLGDLHVHIGKVIKGQISSGETVDMHIDINRRDALRANHSATHLLHAALRKILGQHVTQKGSQVEADGFRFDFSHPKKVTDEERAQIEKEVNEIIKQNDEVVTRIMTPDEAVAQGAMALFGEKYGDEVRVLSMGKADKESYSVELCGGTHVKRTGDIKKFIITSEGSVASGVRRIEGVTRDKVDAFIKKKDGAAKEQEEKQKASQNAAADEAANVAKMRNDFKKSFSKLESINGINFLGVKIDGLQGKELRNFVDEFKNEVKSGVVVIIANSDGKASIAVGVTNDLTSKVNAVDLVKIGAETLGGKGGGGRPDMAQAGGSDFSKADEAIEKIKDLLDK